MRTWTRQEYYDRLYEAAYDGTFPSFKLDDTNSTSGVRCLYRGEGKTRCAFGILIPDECYQATWDNKGILPGDIDPSLYEQVEGLNNKDYRDIQKYHDKYCEGDRPWRADKFIQDLNGLVCFRDVQKKEPRA